MNKLKRHLTVANVLSCIALFVALSATAVAATKLAPRQVKAVNLASQSVTKPKIKSEAVTSGKIKNNGVVTADLANGSVRGTKIANGGIGPGKLDKEAVLNSNLARKSVTETKLAAEAVGTGKIRNEAITPAKLSPSFYKQLLKNVTYVTETSVNDSETEKSVTALCPVGKEAIGGGARINSPAAVAVANTANYPLVSATNSRVGWVATGRETEDVPGNWQVVSYAICAEL